MKNLRIFVGLFFFLCLAPLSAKELPLVKVEKIDQNAAGGCFTICTAGYINGKRTFLKSNCGSYQKTRYANFESDILAKSLFDLVNVRCPDATMVRLDPKSALGKRIGTPILAMEFVDTKFAGGKVIVGHWPGINKAAIDEFINMFLIDILMGNGDRRSPNFFVSVSVSEQEGKESPGSFRPVPIDNNCGFGTMVNWFVPTSQLNFIPTFSGLEKGEIWGDMGTIKSIVVDCLPYVKMLGCKEIHPRIIELAKKLKGTLTNEKIVEMVNSLPGEIIPTNVIVDSKPEWAEKIPATALKKLFPFEGKLSGKALLEYRKKEIISTLKWRRDALSKALEEFLPKFVPDTW